MVSKIRKFLHRLSGREEKSTHELCSELVDVDFIKGKINGLSATNPIEDYLENYAETVEPNFAFDYDFYRSQLPAYITNPLVHYVEAGERSGCLPGPHFDPCFYLQTYRDVSNYVYGPLSHFVKNGFLEGRVPKSYNEDVFALIDEEIFSKNSSGNLFWDKFNYLAVGWRTIDPNPYFSVDHYLREYPDVECGHISPLEHYITDGEPDGAMPSDKFDPDWYYEEYPDVKSAGASALRHYIEHGVHEGRTPLPEKVIKLRIDIENLMRSSGCRPQPTPIALQLPLINSSDTCKNYQRTLKTVVGTFSGFEKHNVEIFGLSRVIAIGGTRYLIDSAGKLIHDEAYSLSGPHIKHEKYSGARRKRREMKIDAGMRPGRKIDRGIHIMHEYDANYFHFIAETLPRLYLASKSGLPLEIPLLVSGGLHRNIVELLNLANTEKRELIFLEHGVLHEIGELYFIGNSSTVVDAYDGGAFARSSFIDTDSLRSLVESVSFQKPLIDSKRIFAIRNGRIRVLKNQGDIAQRLSDIGFAIVDCATLSVEQQMAIFSTADVIVSPTGAQLANIVWCKPSAKIVVLASDHPSHQLYLWNLLSRVSGCCVTHVLGPSIVKSGEQAQVHSDYIVDAATIFSEIYH